MGLGITTLKVNIQAPGIPYYWLFFLHAYYNADKSGSLGGGLLPQSVTDGG